MIYFDSAATTLQKPESVRRAMMRALTLMSSPGRGNHSAARAAAEAAFSCRSLAAKMFGAEGAENVVFTMNATHAINLAVKSLVGEGGRVVISGYEHNAVTRPLTAMRGVETVVAQSPLFDPDAAVESFEAALAQGVDAAVCTHVSNVFGFVLPIDRIAARCKAHGVPLIVDASQSAGVEPVDMAAWGAAFVAMPGHKGLYGPQGTGLLLCAHETVPLIEGGTGSDSLLQQMPDYLPDRLEAGTHNMPGIAGLLAGLRFVESRTPHRILAHERALIEKAIEGLSDLYGVRVFAARGGAVQAGVVSFTVRDFDAEALAEALGARGICVRGGLHCAPTAHRTAGTLDGGTVRVSMSAFNEMSEVEQFLRELRRIIYRKSLF